MSLPKIKAAWTFPENLFKQMVDLETTLVVIIERNGNVQKVWFEKKSGSALSEQAATRAIKKAESLPPIPKELSEGTLRLESGFSRIERC